MFMTTKLLLAEVSSPWVWALIAAGIVIALILPRKLARRSSILDDPARRRTAHEELRHSMDRLLVELQETARDINATLDTKMIALNRLIDDADRRIAALDEMRSAANKPETTTETPQVIIDKEVTPPATPKPEPDTEEVRKRRELEQEIYALADEGKTELEIARITDTPRGEVELVLSLRHSSGDDPEKDGA